MEFFVEDGVKLATTYFGIVHTLIIAILSTHVYLNRKQNKKLRDEIEVKHNKALDDVLKITEDIKEFQDKSIDKWRSFEQIIKTLVEEMHSKAIDDVVKITGDMKEFQDKSIGEWRNFEQNMKDAIVKCITNNTQIPSDAVREHFTNSSQFDRRNKHFAPEKELLSKMVVDEVIQKLKCNDKLDLILILDAGSTVYPVFKKICDHYLIKRNDSYSSRIKIITNNIAGVSSIIKHGKTKDEKSGITKIECRILSGTAQPEYEASLGDQTSEDLLIAINEMKGKLKNQEVEIVGIVSGNYISIDDGILARGKNHVALKQAIFNECKSVYVMSPFGKLWDMTVDKLNELLDIEEGKKYSSIDFNVDAIKNKMKLVITTRTYDYIAQIATNRFADHLRKGYLKLRDQFGAENIVEREFDPLEEDAIFFTSKFRSQKRILQEYEMPHENLREKLIEKYSDQNN